MRRLIVLVVLPLVLSALETVNLIKDAGFEKDSDVWLIRSDADGEYDSTIYNSHDPDSAYVGDYCASIDTRTKPASDLPYMYSITGRLFQVFDFPKKIEDLDSLDIYHMAIFGEVNNKLSTWGYGLELTFFNPTYETHYEAWYFWFSPDLDPPDDEAFIKTFPDTINEEGVWHNLKRDINYDLISVKGLPPEIELDTFGFYGLSIYYGLWRGQKVFFDGIRLTGYADYDVGIKEILSGDSLEKETPYTPIARIKNFGRENASDFSVIAEIFEGTTRVYYDSLPWSLTSDTEDTVTFAAFTPSSAGNHTLIVRTVMEPDESDEDDEMTKTLFGSGIVEQPILQGLNLDVMSLQGEGVLRVRYSLSQNEQGTITLYDPTGRRIESLKVQGTGQVNLSATASGVYFVKLEVGKTVITRKAVLLK